MKNRSQLREIIIKVLYQIYIYDTGKISYFLDDLINEQIDFKNDFVTNSINDILAKQREISALANKYLKDWTIDRVSKVDKAIISLGIYELVYTDTPDIVCINEAVELAKKYSEESVVKMINATLDSIYHKEVENE